MTAWGKRGDMVVHESEPFNAEPSPAALAEAAITSHESFYVRNHGPVPLLSAAAWRLSVSGLVASPLELSLDELRRNFSEHSLTATLECAGNRRIGLIRVRDIPAEEPWRCGAIGTARWRGVRLGEVLAAAGIDEAAQHVEFLGSDISADADPPQHFGGSIPRHKALAEEVLLVWEMNGRPLPREHGGPLRVVVPGYVGARSVKWLDRVNALAEPSENHFQASSYRMLAPGADPRAAKPGAGIPLGAVTLNCDILTPADGMSVPAGTVTVYGYAYAAGDRRVVRVEASADGGATWLDAILLEDQGPWAWRHWKTELDVSPGPVELVARAWDSTGATQPESPARVWNPKGYVNNSWARVGVHAT